MVARLADPGSSGSIIRSRGHQLKSDLTDFLLFSTMVLFIKMAHSFGSVGQ